MIQKLINALAILSFVGVAGIGGAGYYVFANKDSIIKNLIPLPELPGGDLSLPGQPDGEGGLPSLPTNSIPSF